MAPKTSKEKGVASSRHGNKRSKGTQEVPNEDARMPPQPPRHYGLRWVMEKDVLRRARVKKGKRFSFGGLLAQYMRLQWIDEEVVDYRPRYDPKGLDVMKMEPG
ncbi:hypothetical protein HAX54_037940, partial [Datura stramonium]|nr:hypothetical protein [Datura stramonium]